MTDELYKKIRLEIYEESRAGEFSDEIRDKLFLMLEADKDVSLSNDEIDKFMDKLKDQYPNLSDDIKKLNKKISDGKSDDKNDSNDSKGDTEDSDDSGDGDDVTESADNFDSLMKKLLEM